MLVLWFATPFVSNDDALTGHIVTTLLLTLVYISAVWAASHGPKILIVAVILAIACLAILLTGFVFQDLQLSTIGRGMFFVFSCFIIAIILRHIVRAKEVDFDILCGAASVCLLMGIAWVISYWAINDLAPGAFTHLETHGDVDLGFHHFMFFSMTTIVTVGYGDITPVHRFAQMWPNLEAVCGTFYVAVLVARLVSLYRR